MLGSSIVHGFSASRPGMTLPARMSHATGIDFINLGISGECKLQLALADAIANTQADAFLLDCFSNPSSDEIEKYFDDFVARIRINHPQIPLIFVQTLIRESGNFNLKLYSFERRKRWMAEQKMGQLMKSDPYVYFINPGMDVGCDHEGTIDGIHPTDLGFTRIIEGIQTEIIEILKNATND